MKNTTDPSVLISPEYRRFIEELKTRVVSAHLSAARAVNRDLIVLYWDIGRGIVEKQRMLGWGESVVEKVSADLRRTFPQMTGFSPRNLRDTKRFYLAYSDEAIWPQAVAKLEAGASPAAILRPPIAELAGEEKRPQPVAKLTETGSFSKGGQVAKLFKRGSGCGY